MGTVAAGVVKAHADHIVIAGHDGGTGASPQSSLQSAPACRGSSGWPRRSRRWCATGCARASCCRPTAGCAPARDVVIAALLGAEEIGASTAPLVALGCIMMRVCHLNTCPVGIATQDPELRERFAGKPEHVVRFFTLLAEDVRVIMASLGIARFADLVGRVDLLRVDRDRPLEGARARPHAAAGARRRRRALLAAGRVPARGADRRAADRRAAGRARLTLPITNRRPHGRRAALAARSSGAGSAADVQGDVPRLGGAVLRRVARAGRRADRARRRQRLRGQGPLRRRDRRPAGRATRARAPTRT